MNFLSRLFKEREEPTTEQIIAKFGDDAEGVLTKMKSQGDLFEHKPGFWKILE
jgi:hypothetical protein